MNIVAENEQDKAFLEDTLGFDSKARPFRKGVVQPTHTVAFTGITISKAENTEE